MPRQRFRVAHTAQRDDEGVLHQEYVVLDLGSPQPEHPDGPYVHDEYVQYAGPAYPYTPEGKAEAVVAALRLNTENEVRV